MHSEPLGTVEPENEVLMKSALQAQLEETQQKTLGLRALQGVPGAGLKIRSEELGSHGQPS